MKRRTHIYIILVILIFGASAHAITLDEGLDIASKNNPQLISAKKKLEIADARLGQGRSFLMP
ncbi:MAG: hypothetical protein NT030_05910, partial [Candidatus Saganbacteria bacterium]|nr:hypothetical protein [Candidatus Saganbacteria bacterium]